MMNISNRGSGLLRSPLRRMSHLGRQRVFPALLFTALLAAHPWTAAAQVEVEADPLAYAANGFSLHVAKVFGAVRLNVGTFGADIPAFFHGNDGWSSSMRGAGVKLDWLGSSIDGLFTGVEAGYMRSRYARDGNPGTVERDVAGVGVRGGYRLPVGRSGLYVVPWVGVSYNFDGDDVIVAGEEFSRSSVTIFPTVHIGWRF
jgi:hypothetical protein